MKIGAVAAVVLLVGGMSAQTRHSVVLHVNESAGIRRTAYPVNARVPLPRGALTDGAKTRLMLDGKEIPAQILPETMLWPDGSIQWLQVDFNASIGPRETAQYELQYGEGVTPGVSLNGPGGNGLAVSETAETITVGRVQFNKSGAPLLASVKYRSELIGKGVNGLVVTDAAGHEHDLSSATDLKTEVVKSGPLYVGIRYTGRLPVDSGYSVPFRMLVEMPNSKAWVKVTALVDDPAKRLREIAFETPLSLGPMPWVWDFGTERWTYGALRGATEAVELTQSVKAAGTSDWKIETGPAGNGQAYEAGTMDRNKVIRWGHIQDGKEAIAFAVDVEDGRAPVIGTRRMTIRGDGQLAIRFAPLRARGTLLMTVYEHYVAPPVQIGAATSPSSALSPLVVTVDAKK